MVFYDVKYNNSSQGASCFAMSEQEMRLSNYSPTCFPLHVNRKINLSRCLTTGYNAKMWIHTFPKEIRSTRINYLSRKSNSVHRFRWPHLLLKYVYTCLVDKPGTLNIGTLWSAIRSRRPIRKRNEFSRQ